MKLKWYLSLFLLILFSILREGHLLAQVAQEVGTFQVVEGRVSVTRDTTVIEGKEGDKVIQNDLISTEALSKALILFSDRSTLNLGEETTLRITETIFNPAEARRSSVFNLFRGKARALATRFFGPGNRFEIRTPTAVAGVKGSDFILEHTLPSDFPKEQLPPPQTGETFVICLDDVIEVFNPEIPEQRVDLQPGFGTRILPHGPPTPPVLMEFDRIDRLLGDVQVRGQSFRQERPGAAPPAVPAPPAPPAAAPAALPPEAPVATMTRTVRKEEERRAAIPVQNTPAEISQSDNFVNPVVGPSSPVRTPVEEPAIVTGTKPIPIAGAEPAPRITPPMPVTTPPVTIPPVTAPPVTIPPITTPPITTPPITVPPITTPPTIVTVPPVTTPPITVPPVTVPPVTAITIPPAVPPPFPVERSLEPTPR